MWRNLHASGARCLIAAGVIEGRANLREYCRAIAGAVRTVCLLTAGDDELRDRIEQQGRERGADLEKLQRRAIQRSRALELGDCVDSRVDTAGHDIPELARIIFARAGGWPGRVAEGIA